MARLAQWVAAAALVASATAATGEEATSHKEIGKHNNQTLFWGPYKPNLYFGVRPRTPEGLWTGLMWGNVDNYPEVQSNFRYTCEQGENIHGYGWDEFDAREGGVQSIHDDGNKIDITTSFVKIPGGEHGGSWAARIKGEVQGGAPADLKTMVYYYIAQEGDGQLTPQGTGGKLGFDGDIELKGESKALGAYSITVTKGEGDHPRVKNQFSDIRSGDKTLLRSVQAADDTLWQGKGLLYNQLQEAVKTLQDDIDVENPPPAWQVYRLEHRPAIGNAHLVQKTFEGSFEFDVIFNSESAGHKLGSEDVTKEAKKISASFSDRFKSVFDLKAPFNEARYAKFGKSMFSNLIGGVGYFSGHQLIDRSYADEYDELNEGFWEETASARARKAQKLEGPYELFTSVPSRPFFPRGFLWDEGFHLFPIADWDSDLVLEIIESWYNTMDDDGWIPREQILGAEARSKVPEEFQVQYPHYANPPTLFLVIEGFMTRLNQAKASGSGKASGDMRTAHLDHPEAGEEYLRNLYPLLRRQYDWFRKTQRGEIKAYDREAFSTKEAYRWRGRTEALVLTSGLDDYPRASPPHSGELHVDLMAWVGLMSKSLMNIAEALGHTEDAAELKKNFRAIQQNLNDLHWSEKEGCYCDATIDEFEEHSLVCHKGYVSLFPFLLGLIEYDDPKLGKTLDLIGDESHLFSRHGIRSLSKQDPFYETGENYWRSPVWMPINYLAVTKLYDVATHDGPFQEQARGLYSQLRKNLVNTVYRSWVETGFAWEQYNPETGAGQRTQHFTGWTSLVVKIMAMEDLPSPAAGKDEL
ncbi:glycoside hydrolase [Sarocladium strictum]